MSTAAMLGLYSKCVGKVDRAREYSGARRAAKIKGGRNEPAQPSIP